MKVVLFCGGLGMRIREPSETVPKPMVEIGYRPILWHVMKYYAHFGHTEFILCLGYRGDLIKRYFLNYEETLSNDFTLADGGRSIELVNSDIHDWRITFVETGASATIGERLKAVEPYVRSEEIFLANYSDGLTDLNLNQYIDTVIRRDVTAGFLCVRPTPTFHKVSVDEDDLVSQIDLISEADVWINGGFFVFRTSFFDILHEGEDLVREPFDRLIAQRQLFAYRYRGFWTAMDTFKDKERLEEMYGSGEALWEVWKRDRGHANAPQEIGLLRTT